MKPTATTMHSYAKLQQDDYNRLSFSFTWTVRVGATITVLVTTLDDSAWLMPFVAAGGYRRGRTLRSRLMHAATFLATLMVLSFLCCILALGVVKFWGQNDGSTGIKTSTEILELQLEWISVLLCWALGAGFYIKKQLKNRKKLRQEHQQSGRRRQPEENEESSGESQREKIDDANSRCCGVRGETEVCPTDDAPEKVHPASYGSLLAPQTERDFANHPSNEGTSNLIEEGSMYMHYRYAPMTVASLTALGFLDEISYFLTLIVGNIFTMTELLLGTLLAGITMFGIHAFLFRRCQVLVDFLDERVPLYTIIAFILTGSLAWDIHQVGATPDT